MSNKRILPALILAGCVGFLGLHRLYAGRFRTGFLQMGLFVIGAAVCVPAFGSQLASLQTLQTIDQIEDWAQSHPVQPLPVLLATILLLIPSIWALIDCYSLIARKFLDGAGEKITRWI
jgi:TM2 domain-containing membrane protein YozV